jgi:hypothetical protein
VTTAPRGRPILAPPSSSCAPGSVRGASGRHARGYVLSALVRQGRAHASGYWLAPDAEAKGNVDEEVRDENPVRPAKARDAMDGVIEGGADGYFVDWLRAYVKAGGFLSGRRSGTAPCSPRTWSRSEAGGGRPEQLREQGASSAASCNGATRDSRAAGVRSTGGSWPPHEARSRRSTRCSRRTPEHGAIRACPSIREGGIFPVNVPVPVPVPGVWEAVEAPSCACCMVFPWHGHVYGREFRDRP